MPQAQKPAAPPAKPPAPPPPPVARPPAVASTPAAPQPKQGGEELFEPSIVGNVGMGAEVARAAQAQAAAKASAAAPEPEGFDGTVYGAQVARVLVKAIREEKPGAADADAESKGFVMPQAVLVGGPPRRPPSFLWLKIKFLLMLIVGLGVVMGFVWWAMKMKHETDVMNVIYKKVNSKKVDFVRDYEDKRAGDARAELATLNDLRKDIQEAQPKLRDDPEFADKIRRLDEETAFLAFERKLRLAISASDKGAASQLIDDMTAKGTPQQRDLMPLCRLIVRYELFHKKYPNPPQKATEYPPFQEVSELLDSNFASEYRNSKLSLEGEGKQLFNLAQEVEDGPKSWVDGWKKFWDSFNEYKNATPGAKSKLLDDLKREYGKLSEIQGLK